MRQESKYSLIKSIDLNPIEEKEKRIFLGMARMALEPVEDRTMKTITGHVDLILNKTECHENC